jgi:hypothetical protein
LGAAVYGAPALARTIIDTGAPTSDCNSCELPLNTTHWVAAQFHVPIKESIEFTDGYIGGTSGNSFTIALLSNTISNTPGSELFSTTALFKDDTYYQGNQGFLWPVTPGYYWIAFEVGPTDNLAGGFMTTNSPKKLVTELGNGTSWTPDGKVALGVRIFRPPDAHPKVVADVSDFRSSGALPSAVPEPAAWSLMLVGLGGLGAALRSRRHKAVAA